MRWMAARAVIVRANAMLPATMRRGARGSSSHAMMLTTLSARSPLVDAMKSRTSPSRRRANRFRDDASTPFETASTIVADSPDP